MSLQNAYIAIFFVSFGVKEVELGGRIGFNKSGDPTWSSSSNYCFEYKIRKTNSLCEPPLLAGIMSKFVLSKLHAKCTLIMSFSNFEPFWGYLIAIK